MSDLFTEVMSASAAINASEAASESKKAHAAARETLESSGHNPFVCLEDLDLDTIEGSGPLSFLGFGSKNKIKEKGIKVSIKRTDISHLKENTDDFGTTFTEVYLHDDCSLEMTYIRVAGNMESTQTYLNSL